MDWYDSSLFCDDLPTRPDLNSGIILVTGASGYVGGRLVTGLLKRGYRVRIMVRSLSQDYNARWPEAEIVVGDALDPESLERALDGIGAAFYLIHSLVFGSAHYLKVDCAMAENFRIAAEKNNIKRIIYLGGLGAGVGEHSPELKTRMKVAGLLKGDLIPVTVLRTSLILGSGSASFEMIKHLVTSSPVIFLTDYLNVKCQPIGIRDVLKYLVGVLETPETKDKSYDIGGKDILTYFNLFTIMGEIVGKKSRFIHVPFLKIASFSYLLSLLTPVSVTIIRFLMEGISHDIVCSSYEIRKIIPFTPASYREMVRKALAREIEEDVDTRWSDAYPVAHSLEKKLSDLDPPPNYSCSYSILSKKKAESIFFSVTRIGGASGWFNSNVLWKIRGVIDSLLMGAGAIGICFFRFTILSLQI
ncbi:MAG: NAD(P)H-binding protein [Desulfobacterium sp.]|nr:NAD(P)H-binding protein [Desulfobacterium sp.]